MSIPDHGEYEESKDTKREHHTISMAKVFLDFYLEDEKPADLEAALTMLNRVFLAARNRVDLIAPTLAHEIEVAAAPITAHDPTFSDVAEPGPVVHVPLIRVIPAVLEDEPE